MTPAPPLVPTRATRVRSPDPRPPAACPRTSRARPQRPGSIAYRWNCAWSGSGCGLLPAALEDATALTLGAAAPDTVVDPVGQRVLHASFLHRAVGADAAGRVDPHAVTGEERCWRVVAAAPVAHPLEFDFVHGHGLSGRWPLIVGLVGLRCRVVQRMSWSIGGERRTGDLNGSPKRVQIRCRRGGDPKKTWLHGSPWPADPVLRTRATAPRRHRAHPFRRGRPAARTPRRRNGQRRVRHRSLVSREPGRSWPREPLTRRPPRPQ